MFFSQNMFYKQCKKAILVVMNAKQRRFWTFWEVKHELCAARLESLFVFLVWHPQKFKVDSRSQFLNQSSWIFLSGVFHEFKQFSWFWNKSVLLNHPSEHETAWLYHFQVVSSSFCNLKCTNSTKTYGFFLNKFRLCKWFVFSLKEKFIQFFLSFA